MVSYDFHVKDVRLFQFYTNAEPSSPMSSISRVMCRAGFVTTSGPIRISPLIRGVIFNCGLMLLQILLQTHLKQSSFPDCYPGSLLDVAYGLAQPISKPQHMASMALWPSGQAIAQLPLRSLHTNVEPLLSGALHSHNNHCKSPSAKCGGWDLVTVLAATGEFPHQAIWSGKSADLQFVLFQCRGS